MSKGAMFAWELATFLEWLGYDVVNDPSDHAEVLSILAEHFRFLVWLEAGS